MSNRDPLDQLASFRIEPDRDTRERDLEAIRVELRRPQARPSAAQRRWTLGVVVAVILAGPTAAIAAGDALPGDALYPIKRVAEQIVELFDPDVVAEHRVEEVAGLVDRRSDDVVIEQRIDIARAALADTDAPLLERELDRVVDRWVADRATEPDRRTDTSPVTTEPSQGPPAADGRERGTIDDPAPTTTTTERAPTTEPLPSDRATTTAPRDTEDRARPGDRPRDTP